MRTFINKLNTGQLTYDFNGRWRRWAVISAVLVVISLLALVVRPLNFGIEFRGGADFQVPLQVQSDTVDELRKAVVDTGLPDLDDISVTTIGDGTVRVQTRSLSVDEVATVRGAIADYAKTSADNVAYSLIGPTWGKQITNKGLLALGIFLVLAALLMWAYFRDWKMAASAMVALAHDLVITIGVYALIGFSVTPATVIGVLTILGYSLYDTVVVFDKVRENVRDLRSQSRTYTEASNTALNQVLYRSLNTTIIGVLPVVALLIAGAGVLGQGPLKDLALALFVGMIVGAYSSIFLATPMLALLREREPGMVLHRERLAQRRAKAEKAEKAEAEKATEQGALTAPAVRVTSASEAPVLPTSGSARRPQPRRNSRSQRRH